MAVTVTSTERVVQKEVGVGGAPPPRNNSNGNGSRGGGGRDDSSRGFSGERYRIGMWVALASIVMLFTALTSAYIVRSRMSNDWQPIGVPPLLWVSTGLILMSSLTFEVAKKTLKRGREQAYKLWLTVTVFLGLGFLAAQLLAWRQLVMQGIYVASNPHSSFFYLLTGTHGVHLLFGILALDYLLLRAWRKRRAVDAEARRQAAADTVALYWHFMDGLWIYLFLLLFLWR